MAKAKLTLQRKRDSEQIDNLNQHILIKVRDKKGNLRNIPMHGYLIGLELANAERRRNEDHSIGLVVGGVGSGKTTLVKGMAGVNATLGETRFSLNNMVWTTDAFTEKYHAEKMKGKPIVWDESIDGIGKLNNSSKGERVKKSVVTGRFQLHTTYLLVDEVVEFHPKLVRMAHFLIRVMRFGTKRGYFEVYTDKRKIKFIYDGFKYYGKNWSSPEIRQILPDCRGRFPDYSNIFFNKEDYDSKKLEETREENTDEILWKPNKIAGYGLWKAKTMNQEQIAETIGVPYSTFRGWVRDYKKIDVVCCDT
jgi:hypothetical protein